MSDAIQGVQSTSAVSAPQQVAMQTAMEDAVNNTPGASSVDNYDVGGNQTNTTSHNFDGNTTVAEGLLGMASAVANSPLGDTALQAQVAGANPQNIDDATVETMVQNGTLVSSDGQPLTATGKPKKGTALVMGDSSSMSLKEGIQALLQMSGGLENLQSALSNGASPQSKVTGTGIRGGGGLGIPSGGEPEPVPAA